MNNNKILIELEIPLIEKKYDLFIPINKKIGTIKSLIEEALVGLSAKADFPKEDSNFYSKETGEIYDVNKTVRDTDLKNGSRIILIKEENMSDYNDYVTAVNKIFDYLTKMRAGWDSQDNISHIENIEEYKRVVVANVETFKKPAPMPQAQEENNEPEEESNAEALDDDLPSESSEEM